MERNTVWLLFLVFLGLSIFIIGTILAKKTMTGIPALFG